MMDDEFLNGANFWENEIAEEEENSPEEEEDDHELNEDLEEESDEDLQEVVTINTSTSSQISTHLKSVLQEKKNILIECPPGLHRQMIILQTVINHYKSNSDNNYKIYFVTNGFKEMTKILSLIKETFEGNPQLRGIKIAVLGPRENFCVRQEAERGATTDDECKTLVRNFNWNMVNGVRGPQARPVCGYYQNSVENHYPDRIFSFTEASDIFGDDVVLVRDIEDFVGHGREVSRCPYFDSLQSMHNNANLVVCPAQIMLSPVLRREYNIQLMDSIVIFDDGYDVEFLACNEGSVIISSRELMNASQMLRNLIVIIRQHPRLDVSPDIVQLFTGLVDPLQSLSDYVVENGLASNDPSQEQILEQLMSLFHITIENNNRICDTLQELPNQPGVDKLNNQTLVKLKTFLTVLCLALNNDKDYNMLVTEQDVGGRRPQQVLKLICANASVTFGNAMNQSSSVIVAGDCLAPISMHRNYLGIEFHEECNVVHENPGANTSYFLGYCSRGPNDEVFALNYNARQDPIVQREVAQSILTFSQIIPNGVIILFHSRRYFSQIIGYLRKQGPDGGESLLDQIKNFKHVIMDFGQQSDEAKLDQYKDLSQHPHGNRTGAVLLCLARGTLYQKCKIEQLKGKEVRGIIHISMTYASWHYSDFTVGRRKYFERHVEGHGEPDNGNHTWYESEAFRVSNQAFANIVQNTDDWGIVVVLDGRMHSRRYSFPEYLPVWVNHLRRFKQFSFPALTERMETFIRNRLRENI